MRKELAMTGRKMMIALLVLIFSPLGAVAGGWKTVSETSIMLTQNAYSDNWAGEETGSVSWVLNSRTVLERELHARVNNKNTFKFSFGQTHNQEKDTKAWQPPVKSTDLIDVETLFRFAIGFFVDPFASGGLESQFLDRSDALKTRYVNPSKITESLGLARVFLKDEKKDWTARFGVGFRQYVNRDFLADSLSGERTTETAIDGGIEFVNELATPLADERITLSNKLVIFKALFYSKSDELEGLISENYWKAPDVNWENAVTASVTSYLMVNLYTQLLYDKELSLGARFKQTLSLGVTYKVG
jgi:hypothetical protein